MKYLKSSLPKGSLSDTTILLISTLSIEIGLFADDYFMFSSISLYQTLYYFYPFLYMVLIFFCNFFNLQYSAFVHLNQLFIQIWYLALIYFSLLFKIIVSYNYNNNYNNYYSHFIIFFLYSANFCFSSSDRFLYHSRSCCCLFSFSFLFKDFDIFPDLFFIVFFYNTDNI